MPHFVIEYSKQLDQNHNIQDVMKAAFEAGIASGEISPASLKIRALPIEYSYALKENATFVHLTIHLFSGRTVEQKNKIGDLLLKTLTSHYPEVDSVSVDLKDIDKETYKKHVLLS